MPAIEDSHSRSSGIRFSFEFFPPRTAEAESTLRQAMRDLAPLRPVFASITYGAGGGTRDRTSDLVIELQSSGPFTPMPHLTCVGHTEREIVELLESYAAAGVTHILALRGDLPAGSTRNTGDFEQAADLIRCIRRFNERGRHPAPGGFQIAAACFPEGHPATPNRLTEMDHLKAKVDAGADFLITQVFFDNHTFHDFRARCQLAGIHAPIFAGILPLPNAATMNRMAELAGNMRYPAKLLRALQHAGDDPAAFRAITRHHAVEQCHDLLAHEVDGLHFYTLNRAEMTLEVISNLGVRSCREKADAS